MCTLVGKCMCNECNDECGSESGPLNEDVAALNQSWGAVRITIALF